MPKVFDCFPFFNELDIIELRFHELDPYVDYFVVAEAEQTHSGLSKPFYFDENKDRFRQFAHKIIYVPIRDMPTNPEPGYDMHWTRERFQRNCLQRGLAGVCSGSDLILSSDADEITRGTIVGDLHEIEAGEIYNLEMTNYTYFLNLKTDHKWYSSRVFNYKTLNCMDFNLSDIRVAGCHSLISDAGWHMSYMGGAEKVQTKLQSFAHQEYNKKEYTDLRHLKINVNIGTNPWDQRQDIAPCGYVPFWYFVDIDHKSNHPQYLKDHKADYPHLIKDAFYSDFLYDCGNLNHLKLLAEEVLSLNGVILDIGCFEGRTTIQLANICEPQKVIAIDIESQPNLTRNINSLTSGNIEFHQADAIEFLNNLSEPIKFAHLDANYESQFISKCLNIISSKAVSGAIICGYDYKNKQTKAALESFWGDTNHSGRLWFKKIT